MFVFSPILLCPTPPIAFEYLGTATATASGIGDDPVIDLSSLSLESGDIVIVCSWSGGSSSGVSAPVPSTSGYTSIATTSYTNGAGRSIAGSVDYKLMGGSPDSSVTIDGLTTSSGYSTLSRAIAFRGVSLSAPIAGSPNAGSQACNTSHPNPGALTPTSDQMSVYFGGTVNSENRPWNYSDPGDWSNFVTTRYDNTAVDTHNMFGYEEGTGISVDPSEATVSGDTSFEQTASSGQFHILLNRAGT